MLVIRTDFQQEGTPLFKAAGWVEPRPTPVSVAGLAPGVVEQLLVVEDQAVTAGEPIAELVKDDAQLAHERAQADLLLREAELRAAEATFAAAKIRLEQPVHLEAILGEAEAQLAAVQTMLVNLPFEVRRAEAELTYAQLNFEGKSSTSGAVAGRVIGEAKSQFDSAQALVEELRGRFASLTQQEQALARRRDALQKQLELGTEERRARDEAAANTQVAAARLKLAQVALAESKLQLDRMTVRAPIDGRVLRLVAHQGSRLMVAKGYDGMHDASTVVTLYRPEMLQVRVDVRFADLPRVEVGQAVTISCSAVATSITGHVLFVSSEADIQKNTLEVKVAIDSPPSVLKPEMLVDVTFLAPESSDRRAAATDESRLFVPRELVRQDGAVAYVWVADQSAALARRTSIELGPASTDGLVEVSRGLDLASRLIASGHEGLRDGQKIRVTREAPVPPISKNRSP